MATIRLMTELNSKLTLKYQKFKETMEDGGYMVMGERIRGEVLTLIVTWLKSHEDDVDKSDEQAYGQQFAQNLTAKDGFLTNLVSLQGGSNIVELLQAAHQLELWPLVEICCKAIGGMIKDEPFAEIRHFLKLDDVRCKLSVPCIKGILKCLPIEKRIELESIDSNEWQEAFIQLWSEQIILVFVKQGTKFANSVVNTCPHNTEAVVSHGDYLEYSDYDLIANVESIKTVQRRKLPEQFLSVVRKCPNLKLLLWDNEFGEMAGPKLACVLEQVCPHLEHIQGKVKRSFQFEDEGRICPASFLDIYEPQFPCFLATFIEDGIVNQAEAEKRKVDQSFGIDNLKKQRLEQESEIKKLKVKREHEILKDELRPFFTNACKSKTLLNYVDKQWWDKLAEYLNTDSNCKPGSLNLGVVSYRNVKGSLKVKRGLKLNVDYVRVNNECVDKFATVFGVIQPKTVASVEVTIN